MPFQDIPVENQIDFDASDAVTAKNTAHVAARPTYGQLTGFKTVEIWTPNGIFDENNKEGGEFKTVTAAQYATMSDEQRGRLSKTLHLDIDPRILNEKLTFTVNRQIRMRSQQQVDGKNKLSDWAGTVLPSIKKVFGGEDAFIAALKNTKGDAAKGVEPKPLFVWIDVVPSKATPQYTTIEFKKRYNNIEELRQAQQERFASNKNKLPRAAIEAGQAVWDNLEGEQEAFLEWAQTAYPEIADALLGHFVGDKAVTPAKA